MSCNIDFDADDFPTIDIDADDNDVPKVDLDADDDDMPKVYIDGDNRSSIYANHKRKTASSSTVKKRLTYEHIKEKQQQFAMLHFLLVGLNDFLGINLNDER